MKPESLDGGNKKNAMSLKGMVFTEVNGELRLRRRTRGRT